METEIQKCNCSDCNGPRLHGICYYQTTTYVLKSSDDEEILSPTIRKRKNSNTKIENK